jgi:hypothetical protein
MPTTAPTTAPELDDSDEGEVVDVVVVIVVVNVDVVGKGRQRCG